ncbi:thiamine phosphate synthase [Sphingomonas sp.]|uniref:thiamine phosphate synthase n=1 Tax=Sphingomonas sp. TaxID=28214 RepID=UPI002DC03055|nr:thiamine phosphate synthase [Sphingomonas sp.]HEU4968330.1 thiamine phosphate synthase [Sphingomonas sp.]
MKRRQTVPRQWLVADSRLGERLWRAIRKLPRGSGILFLYRDLPNGQRARLIAQLRRLARARGLVLADEAAGAARRVHNSKEMLRAGMAGAAVVFLSPMFETRSHPEWKPIPRMRAAALVRLSNSPVIALGGMDERRFREIQKLGFSGWAGIDAYVP